VFQDHGWISDLDLTENITLAQRHRGGRSARELEEEASRLARTFGLPGLPRGYPADARPGDLCRASCIRAFLGSPSLIILERPAAELFRELMAPLINAVRGARERRAAVLWTTDDGDVWSDPGVRPTSKWVMSGSQLVSSEEVGHTRR
jgi:phospholipid/cholesterol/gamma-HCH transport system ATP-binding protein